MERVDAVNRPFIRPDAHREQERGLALSKPKKKEPSTIASVHPVRVERNDMDNGKGWFFQKLAAINQLAEELELDEEGTQKMRELVLATAKEEFMAGNRSGIKWARTNPHPCEYAHEHEKATS